MTVPEPHMVNVNSAMQSQDDFFHYANVGVPETVKLERLTSTSSDLVPDGSIGPQSELFEHQETTKERNEYNHIATLFLVVSVVSALVVLAFELYAYIVINVHRTRIGADVKYTELSIYLAIFIFACIYQVFLTWLGLKSKNMLLLLFLCVFYACMLIYTGIQYQEINRYVQVVLQGQWETATRATNIAAVGIIGVTMLLQMYLIIFHLRKHVGWFSFKKVGGDIHIKRMYRVFQVHRCLLIFDFFFFLGFTLQFTVIMIRRKTSVEFALTICVIPCSIVVLLVSDLAAVKEWAWLAAVCLAVYLGGIAYVLFKMIRLFTKYSSAYNVAIRPGDYFPGRNSLVTFGVITVLLLVLTVGVEIVIMNNFKKGLKPLLAHSYDFRKISRPQKATPDLEKQHSLTID